MLTKIFENILSAGQRDGPVSYTHLDVYKRQVHGITRRSSLANTGRIDHLLEKHAVTLHDGDLSDSSSPVSYTHLDVYKRQAPTN